jgi:hypothetical protein
VGPDASDDARRRSDEAVRRLRDESARRVDGVQRRRSFSSWCALATLAGGISIAAMNAQEARREGQETLRASAERDARIADACAERSARIAAIWQEAIEKLARAKTEEERARLREDAGARRAQAIEGAARKGCGPSVTTQPAWIAERSKAAAPNPVHDRPYRHYPCGGDPPNGGL